MLAKMECVAKLLCGRCPIHTLHIQWSFSNRQAASLPGRFKLHVLGLRCSHKEECQESIKKFECTENFRPPSGFEGKKTRKENMPLKKKNTISEKKALFFTIIHFKK